MPAPSKSWVVVSDTQVDADSPLDTVLMTGLRDNAVHLKEWMGSSFTPAVDHDHDGINSKSVVLAAGAVVTAKIADANVTLAKLKMTRGSYGASSSGPHYLAIAANSHMPSAYKAGGSYNMQLALQSRSDSVWAMTEKSEITVNTDPSNTETFYVYWDYHVN